MDCPLAVLYALRLNAMLPLQCIMASSQLDHQRPKLVIERCALDTFVIHLERMVSVRGLHGTPERQLGAQMNLCRDTKTNSATPSLVLASEYDAPVDAHLRSNNTGSPLVTQLCKLMLHL